MAKFKHLRVDGTTHTKFLIIRGILASNGINLPLNKIVEKVATDYLAELELAKKK